MKRTIVKTTFLLLSMVSLIALSSCEKDNPPGDGGNDPDIALCNTYGTFTRLLCGGSIYDNYWIRTDDGRYLQPCATDVVTLCPLPIEEGTRVKFAYKKITGPSPCDDIINCEAYDERMAGSMKIRTTCIEILSQPQNAKCSKAGTVIYNGNCNTKVIKGDNGELIEPVNQNELSSYKSGARIIYSFTPVATLSVTCSGYGGVFLTCVRPLMIK